MMEPQMNTDENSLNETIGRIIKCVYIMANILGNGFLEKVYENALARELRKSSLFVEQQKGIKVRYVGAVIADYMADL